MPCEKRRPRNSVTRFATTTRSWCDEERDEERAAGALGGVHIVAGGGFQRVGHGRASLFRMAFRRGRSRAGRAVESASRRAGHAAGQGLSLIHISEPTRRTPI